MEPLDLVVAPGSDGPSNMALDEALARMAPRPALRLYLWPRHEATFGYFQSVAEAQRLAAGLPVTRRLTGGGLVLHGCDITLTLVLPRHTATFPQDVRRGYRLLHSLLRDALSDLGIEACLCDKRPSGPVCFQAPVCDDLIRPIPPSHNAHAANPPVKIAGGAQRRLREGLLHQGSLNIPELPPTETNVAKVAEAFSRHLAQALGTRPPNPREPSADERAEAERLRLTRYSHRAWTAAR